MFVPNHGVSVSRYTCVGSVSMEQILNEFPSVMSQEKYGINVASASIIDEMYRFISVMLYAEKCRTNSSTE